VEIREPFDKEAALGVASLSILSRKWEVAGCST